MTTNGPREGAGHQKLVLKFDGTTTNLRIRHVAGASPFGSSQAGNPSNNVTFTTSTAAVDAYIGFYLKTTDTIPGLTVALNLDDATNTGAGMDMGTPRAVIADGQWRLYEWKLSDPAQWETVTSIGGDGVVQDGSHSIDSIYFFANRTGAAEAALPDIFLDFVAMNDAGSVAQLVPEPASVTLVATAAAAGLLRRRRGRAVKPPLQPC